MPKSYLSEKGSSVVEMALLIGLVAIICLTGVRQFGGRVKKLTCQAIAGMGTSENMTTILQFDAQSMTCQIESKAKGSPIILESFVI